ncbi:MAG: DEAD/DEAH box helicase [Thermoleophilia bacterium]
MTWELSPHVQLGNERIPLKDGYRQQATAAEICDRLNTQVGLILADEVGMGKTFVAFAVAVSILYATERRRPVVVMMPAAVAEKWPRDWSVFEKLCLGPGAPPIRATSVAVRRASEFLKLLDDPPARRAHLVFLTHGALSTSLNDPFIRLALVRQAFRYQRRLAPQRASFPRWAAHLLNDKRFTAPRVRRLLETLPCHWKAEWIHLGGGSYDDDPVPAAALKAFEHVDLAPLRAVLATVPVRSGPKLDRRLAATRQELAQIVQAAWARSLRHLSEDLPLLILDEAHHVKNPNSLARLFESKDALRDAEAVAGNGPLADMFERMLFLTATPFQLGHRELLSVLSRFSGSRVPPEAKEKLRKDLRELSVLLDSAQAASLRLDRAWGRLAPTDLASLPDSWWQACPETAPEAVHAVADRLSEARERTEAAAQALRPWVIRHTKEKARTYRAGQQILSADYLDIGLELSGRAIMPFLLAARAQALVSLSGLRECRATRAYFADGLASSFEAFAKTRGVPEETDDTPRAHDGPLPAELEWYLGRIEASLPESDPDSWSLHPKLKATTDETLRLWGMGEKVVVFCFYRATGRALRSHISRAMRAEIARLGAGPLGLDPADVSGVLIAVERRADSLLRTDSAGARQVAKHVEGIARPSGLSRGDIEQTIEVALRFIRTASFLVRFVDLPARRGADAVDAAFNKADGSGATLGQRLAGFAKMLARLTDVEREGLWGALNRVQTGSITTVDADFYNPDEATGRDITLPNIRLANGTVRRDTRERLMRTFNTPFFPEVLVASSVMAEGVDLHVDCRHVIHHDLDWNPSTLEQRTGRLDRLGSKAQETGCDIVVYEPYMAGAQDEKMYRVVKDRERWFKVLMGERLDTAEWATDRMAERVLVPEGLLSALNVDLGVTGSSPPA